MGKKMDYSSVKHNHKCFCSSSGSVASATSSSSRSSNGVPDKQGLRTIHLRRQCGIYLEGSGKSGDKLFPNVKPNSFGFSFRGGREFGTGFFVSVVERDSEAQYKGLKPGDQIIRINGLPVDDATHQEVLQLAQAHDQLTLTVKSIGIIPVKDKSDDPITWKVVDPISDSQQLTAVGYDVDRILIEIPENTQLGCGICKGPEWRPGIFIQYTKPNSLARRCGLQPGDQILQCNKISFLQIDFTYAVSVLKNAKTLDLVLKKGSGIDLFPGESSGYSSSSSIADETVNQSPSRHKRLSIVAEEGEEKSQRKSCQCPSVRSGLKSSGSIDSIFDNVSAEASAFREKSKSIEILTDSNAKKTVTFGNHENVSRTFLNIKPRESCHCVVGNQTVIKIENKDSGKAEKAASMSIEKQLGEGVISVEVHRSDEKCGSEKAAIEKSPSSSSFSSSCSLSSAISQEILRRKERRLKGGVGKAEKKENLKPVDRQQRHQHDLLIAELKKKQGWEDRSTVSTQTEVDQHSQVKVQQRVREASAEPKAYIPPFSTPPVDSPPACPTPDYFSDTSLTDQSIEASHTVKTSILKFEERNKSHPSNGVTKTVTFGQNSTKEITPVKNIGKGVKSSFGMAEKKSQDRVEMQSIESYDLTEPKQVAPKPPPVYFQPPSRNDASDSRSADVKKRTTVIKITEYPTDKRREPAKFDFIHRNSENDGFESELASTLSRSNLKNKMDAFANLSNGSVIKNGGNDKTSKGVAGRYNGFHAIPPVIPTDFEDMVLVESPFAETTREGRGIRQVQIGLTPTKLVLATDIIKHACDYPVAFFPGCIDAEIESLELISIFPIELVTLSVFRRRRRKVLKAKFHDGNPNHNCKIVYFELGGSDKRKMFWNLWCERVRFLSPEDKAGSSLTETSVASSTSASSLHVARTRVSKDKIWQYYAGNPDGVSNSSLKKNLRWTDKDLFFGDKLELISYKIEPISYSTLMQNDTDEIRTLYRRQRFQVSRSSLSSNPSKEISISSAKKAEHINRFGEGIDEGCKTGLYLPAISYSKCSFSIQSMDSRSLVPKVKYSAATFTKMCEDALEVWERPSSEAKGNRHPRHYGLTSMSDLTYGLGIFLSGRGDIYSLQMKKSASLVSLIGETVTENEFEKPTKRLHLCNSTSHESIRPWSAQHVVEQQPIHFWTTDYWYRPNTIKTIYRGNQNYLKKLKMYLRSKSSHSSVGIPRKMRLMNFGKKLLKNSKVFYLDYDDSLTDYKKKLKLENSVSVWDIDSTTMAFQLTMLDSQLFLKIPADELRLLLVHRNGKSCLNFMTWIVFSHRISCLVATEVLLTGDVKYRARLISRFINAAEKCHLLHNFQSCRSILCGLQSPAVYRLKSTWCQVRHNHATKYQIFEKLSRLYRDPRLTSYQKCFHKSSLEQPYLPSSAHILATLLGQTVKQHLKTWSSTSLSQVNELGATKNLSIVEQCQTGKKSSVPKLLKQIFSALKIYPNEKMSKTEGSEKSEDREDCDKFSIDSQSVLMHLDPLSPEEMLNATMKTFLQHFRQSEVGSGFEDAETLLKNGQKAARKYDLSENSLAKNFLLRMPYKERRDCYFASFRIEPD